MFDLGSATSVYGWKRSLIIYSITAIGVLSAGVTRGFLNPLLLDHSPFFMFFVVVVVAGWLGGVRPALFASAIGYLAAWFFFIPPHYSFALPTGPYLVELGMYVTVSLAFAVFGETIRIAQLRMAEQQERFRTMLASIGDGVITTDIEGRITNLNVVAESLTQWRNADAIGLPLTTVFRIVHETTREVVENPALRALQQGIIAGLANHTLLIARDGSERLIDDNASPIRSKEGKVVGCVLVFRDVREPRANESANKETIAILDSLSDGFWRVAADWRFVYINPAACQSVGLKHEDLIGKSIWEVFPNAEGSDLEVQYRRAATERKTVDFDHFYEPLGQWFNSKVSPAPDGGIVVLTRDITDRKREAAALQQAEAERHRGMNMLRAVSDSTTDLIYAKDLHSRLVFANPSTLSAIGLPATQALGKNEVERGIIPSEAEAIITNDQRIIETGQADSFEELFTGPMGTRTFLSSKAPLRDSHGTVIGIVGISRDITELKTMEKSLRFQLDLTKSITDNATTAIFMMDDRSRCTFMNPAAEQMTGFRFEEVEGGILHDFIHHHYPDGRPYPMPECPIDRALPEAGAVHDHEDLFFRKNGTPFTVACNARVIYKDGKAVGTVIEVRDTTKEKAAATALQQSESRYRLVGEAANDAIWDWDLTSNKVTWSDSVRRTFGYTAEQVGEDAEWWVGRVHPDDRSRIVQEIHATINGVEEFWSDEYRFQRSDGTYAVVFDRGRVFREDNRPVRMVGSMLDLTERKRLEDELRAVAAELSEGNRRKDEFLATLAHELRNPLAPIRTGLQFMKLAGDDTAAIEQSRNMMERQLEQMVRLVDDLMDVSRITTGKVELRKQRLSLADVLNSAVETSRPLIDQMGHELTVTIPSESIFVLADMTRLTQVFANLLNNSAKYSNRGGKIWLTVEKQGDDAIVSVRDTGIGIPATHLKSVFEMFSQVDRSLERSQSGLGIGLTLVQRLVELHGGTIEAKSEGIGKGSEFVVCVPLIDAREPHFDSKDECIASKSSHRILIVDDNKDGADSLSMVLKIMGYETHTAYDGQQGIEEASRLKPDIILFDIGLPKMNGYEACSWIREQPWGKSMMLIAVTGWGQEEDRRRSRNAGFNHHLVKPIDPMALIKLLAKISSTSE